MIDVFESQKGSGCCKRGDIFGGEATETDILISFFYGLDLSETNASFFFGELAFGIV